MGLQSKWIKEVITQAKLNNMTIIGETGTDLSALTGKVKGQVVISYDTSAGFVQWFMYVWDGISQWIKVSLPTHKHIDSGSGGSLQDILHANPVSVTINDILAQGTGGTMVVDNAGTGSAANASDNGGDIARRYQTGTTTTGYAGAKRGGTLYPNYSALLWWNWVWQLSATNNQFFLFGTNMENVNSAQNNNAKTGIEWCDGQAAANYFVTTASGSARSSSDSTVALTTGVDGARMFLTPGSQAQFVFDAGPTTINKGTNLPTGGGEGHNAIREGIKNNNGGASNRDLRILGMRLHGQRNITQWVIV